MQFFNTKTLILLIPVLLVALYFIVHKGVEVLKRKRAEELFENYHKDKIIYFSKEVDFFGQKSLGDKQLKSNGSLLLTPDELHFIRWVPKKDIMILLNNIENIDRVNSFLGKDSKKDLLKIDFINDEGEKDSAAWEVENMHAWEQVIEDNIH